jgi:hypothetical protein
MGQHMINVEKTNNEGESKTEKESVHEAETRVMDRTADKKCRENRQRGRKQDR